MGGFDPVHVGHVRLMKHAKSLADKLVVILNNDNWLKAKKGFAFMNEKERKVVIESIKYVDEVVVTKHPKNPRDMSVVNELKKIKPHIFANGGDRDKKDATDSKSSLSADILLCHRTGIEIVYNVGGGKIQSSSQLVKNTHKNLTKK